MSAPSVEVFKKRLSAGLYLVAPNCAKMSNSSLADHPSLFRHQESTINLLIEQTFSALISRYGNEFMVQPLRTLSKLYRVQRFNHIYVLLKISIQFKVMSCMAACKPFQSSVYRIQFSSKTLLKLMFVKATRACFYVGINRKELTMET